METDIMQSIDLQKAQDLILDVCSVVSDEAIPLAESLGRFPADALVSLAPLPGYDQSLRDGYAVGKINAANSHSSADSFQIVDEVAAGDTRKLKLKCGLAIRIMTGGLIPGDCVAVIPQEDCTVIGKTLKVAKDYYLRQKNNFIHTKGSELDRGQVIAPKHIPISPEQLILLAGVGYNTVPVVRKPTLSFFCTGNELVNGVDEKMDGRKFSANDQLLQGLTIRSGAELQDHQSVTDDVSAVAEMITSMAQTGCDILVSTGGMGGGKFDLIEEAFCRVGGKVIYNSLNMRPGNSTLFGTLGNTFFFGLPGPPPAVNLLFNELIYPAILALQGAKHCRPQKCEARLTEDLFFPKRGLARLKGGQLHFRDGICLVRPTNRVEASNCSIFCPATRRQMRTDEKVLVHLFEPTFFV